VSDFVRWMAGFSTIYISAAITLYALGFGDASLVYANTINLSARIVYSLHFISSYFRFHQTGNILTWKKLMPSLQLILFSLLSTFIIKYHAHKRDISNIVSAGGRIALLNIPVMTHVGLGGLLALVCIFTWWISSGRFLIPARRVKTE
jgi:oligosaccharide translocation protein RFT1